MRKSLPQPDDRGDRRRSPIAYLTQDETKRLFSAIKTKRDRAIFLTAYRHGLRASEIGMLQRTDVDLKSGRLTSSTRDQQARRLFASHRIVKVFF